MSRKMLCMRCHLHCRNWCPIRVGAGGREDTHMRSRTQCGGKPIIVTDYKLLGTDIDEDADEMKLTMVVMRDQSTGVVASHICERKGRVYEWIANRLVDDIEA